MLGPPSVSSSRCPPLSVGKVDEAVIEDAPFPYPQHTNPVVEELDMDSTSVLPAADEETVLWTGWESRGDANKNWRSTLNKRTGADPESHLKSESTVIKTGSTLTKELGQSESNFQ